MLNQFSRSALLLGQDALAHLAACRVAVFGLGGVGSYVVEALARSGVGTLDLIDNDRVSLTNLNRQLFALHSTLGQFKVDVARARVTDINPGCRVNTYPLFYLPETQQAFDFSLYDYVVDAIDTVKAKLALAEQARAAHTPLISCMGTGNKLNPAALRVADIYQTAGCPLARVMRAECRKRGIPALKVVYSTEPPRSPTAAPPEEDAPAGRRSVPGSVPFVPSAAGLLLASEVVRDLLSAAPRRI